MRPFAFSVLAIALFSPAVASATGQTSPADFPITIHVVASHSRVLVYSGLSNYIQYIETVIDNQPVELGCNSEGVLALGDYQARVSTKIHSPSKKPNSYDIYRGYDLLMPDNVIRTCEVTGLGPAMATNP